MENNNKNKLNRFIKSGIDSKFGTSLATYFICLIVAFILSSNKIFTFSSTDLIASDIVVALLPCIVTIISISFSLSSNKIFGIPLNSFKKIRDQKYFSFKEMIYIVIFTFLFYTISRIFDLRLCIIVIDFFSLFYSWYFVRQDIVILENDEKKLIKDLVMLFEEKTEGTFDIEKQKISKDDDLYKMLSYLMLSRGLDKTIELMKDSLSYSNETKILNSLLFVNISELKQIHAEKEFYFNKNYKESLKEILSNCFDNIIFLGDKNNLLKFNNSKRTEELVTINENITEITSILYEICNEQGFLEYFESKLNDVSKVYSKLFGIEKNIDLSLFKIFYFNRLVINQIKLNNFYFLNVKLSKDDDIPYIFKIDDALSFYVGIVLISISNNIYFGNELIKDKVDEFLNSKFRFESNEGTVINYLKYTSENISSKSIIEFLLIFLKLFDDTFEKGSYIQLYNYIICSWIELLLLKFLDISTFEKEEFNNVMNKLKEEDKIAVIKFLNKYFYDIKIKKNLNLVFINNFDKESKDFLNYPNKELFNYLEDYINDVLKEDVKKLYYLENKNIKDIENSFKNTLKEEMNKFDFYDDNLVTGKEVWITFTINFLNVCDFDNIDLYSSNYNLNMVNLIIQKELLRTKNTTDKNEIIEKANKIVKNDSSRKINSFDFDKNGNFKDLMKIVKNIDTIDLICLPDFLMWEKDGIKLNVQIDSLDRIEKEDDINKIFEKFKSTKQNDLYRVFINNEIKYIYLNENELKEYIKNIYFEVTYKYNFKVEEDKMLYIKDKVDFKQSY